MHSTATVTFARRMGFIAVAACLAFAPSFAADPKPDAAIKNRNVEANVFLDDKIKADPALAADCLAEGKKWIDKNAAETNASRKQDPQLFHDGGWSFERKYDTRSVVDGHYVSIVRSDYIGHPGRASQFGRQYHPVGRRPEEAHQHPALLHRDHR